MSGTQLDVVATSFMYSSSSCQLLSCIEVAIGALAKPWIVNVSASAAENVVAMPDAEISRHIDASRAGRCDLISIVEFINEIGQSRRERAQRTTAWLIGFCAPIEVGRGQPKWRRKQRVITDPPSHAELSRFRRATRIDDDWLSIFCRAKGYQTHVE